MKPLLVVLDLDETLFFSSKNILDRSPDFLLDEFFVYKRPGVDDFLEKLFSDKRFNVAVYTAASKKYALSALSNLSIDVDKLALFFSITSSSY